MATKKELYGQKIQGYLENPCSGHIYMVYQGHYSENSNQERIFWNASAINLRTGKSRRLKLKDFMNLQKLDSGTTKILESNIHISHFIESYRNIQPRK